MDAVEFLKEKDRMCKLHLSGATRGSECKGCGLNDAKTWTMSTCHNLVSMCPEKAVAIVERWAKEHPRKNRQNEFLKLFPRASMTADDVIAFCPESMDSAFVCPIKERDRYDPECGECRRKYWLEEVEEDGD